MRISDWSSDVCSSDLADMPPIQIYGTTGKSWQASVIRHVPLQGPCSLCLFPDSGPVALTACATGKVVSPVNGKRIDAALPFLSFAAGLMPAAEILRTEERRVGKEGVSTCRSRWWPYPYNKNNNQR